MAKFTVDRTKWYRGQGYTESRLLRGDGMMCCIGFVGLQCGISPEALMGQDIIWRSVKDNTDPQPWPAWMTDQSKPVGADITAAYIINDDRDIDDAAREKKLQGLFAEYGDEIVFEN